MASNTRSTYGLILLDSGGHVDSSGDQCSKSFLSVGAIILENASITLKELRKEIRKQFTFSELKNYGLLMDHYCFVSTNGFQFSEINEETVCICDVLRDNKVIALQRHTELPEIGIRNKLDQVIGFVHIEYVTYLRELREAVEDTLGWNTSKCSFRFISRQGLRIALSDEKRLHVYDILDNKTHCVAIDSNEYEFEKKSQRFTLFSKSENTRKLSSELRGIQQVMISYTRNDSVLMAKQICDELRAQGVNAIMSSHKFGGEFNSEESNNVSSIFVPIVTHNYGLTFWSKYEIQSVIGEGKNRQIIPLSLVEDWPPMHLYMAFLDTNPINALKKECSLNFTQKYRLNDAKRVAKLINERLNSEQLSNQSGAIMPNEEKCIEIAIVSLQLNSKYCEDIRCDVESNFPAIDGYDSISCSIILIDAENELIDSNENIKPLRRNQKSPFVKFRKWKRQLSIETNKSNERISTQNSSINAEIKSLCINGVECCAEEPNHIMETTQLKRDNQLKQQSVNGSIESIKNAKSNIDSSKVVIILISNDALKSNTFLKLMYYCELKTNVIYVCCGETDIFKGNVILDNDEYLELNDEDLKTKISDKINHLVSLEERKHRNQLETIYNIAKPLRDHLGDNSSVYIIGSSIVEYQHLKDAYFSFGSEFAKLNKTSFVVSHLNKSKELIIQMIVDMDDDVGNGEQSKVVNVLPSNISELLNVKQTSGCKTIFVGSNDRETSKAIAAVCDVCVLFVDKDINTDEINLFDWNEKFLIPVLLNASDIPEKVEKLLKSIEMVFGVNRSELTIKKSGRRVAKTVTEMIKRANKM